MIFKRSQRNGEHRDGMRTSEQEKEEARRILARLDAEVRVLLPAAKLRKRRLADG